MENTDPIRLAAEMLRSAEAVLVTASNGLSIAEGYAIFANNDDYRKYFGAFRKKYGTDCLIRGVFTPMTPDDKRTYMETVRRYLIEEYHPSQVMENLKAVLSGKEYFILTSNADTHFQLCGFDAGRIFEAEGNFDGLKVQSMDWEAQYQRYQSFVRKNAEKKTVLLELGIGAQNQLIKAPTMQVAAGYPSWRYITLNLPHEEYILPELSDRALFLPGDIGVSLRQLKNEMEEEA